ncbi:hypothetical protein LJK88_03465 [Paenibacillus sp. P26]|nr:hypothetical protein LJK88_03465 [Paenibacillus sp. P26]
MPKEKAESSGNTAAHHELDPKTAGLQEDRHEAEGKPGDEDKSAEAVEKGMIKGTPARPHRGRPGKRGKSRTTASSWIWRPTRSSGTCRPPGSGFTQRSAKRQETNNYGRTL